MPLSQLKSPGHFRRTPIQLKGSHSDLKEGTGKQSLFSTLRFLALETEISSQPVALTCRISEF